MLRREFLSLAPAAGLATLATDIRPAAAGSHDDKKKPAVLQRFGVGDIRVTTLSDGGVPLGSDGLSNITREDYDRILLENFRNPDGFLSGVNAFLVEAGDNKMLVDCGTGGVFGPAITGFDNALAATGVKPKDITHLMASHLHPDHVGGAVKDGKAAFPNAELVVHSADQAFWGNSANFTGAPEQVQGFAQLAQGVLASYADRLNMFDAETEIVPGVTALPLPGHTPGHSGFMITSGDDSMLIWADIVHVAPVQLARPEVTIAFDVDQALAAETRAALLDRVVADRLTVAGSHIGFPGVVNIARATEGYRAVPAAFDYGV